MSRLFHFSEDPAIGRFEPHVPATNPEMRPLVWAIDEAHAPLYWFPRHCPRATVWARDDAEQQTLTTLFATTAPRLHATELEWREAMLDGVLYRYEFAAEPFSRWADANGHWVSEEPVEPVAVQRIDRLGQRHRDEGIELRFLDELWTFWDRVVESGLAFSGVRLANARPRLQ